MPAYELSLILRTMSKPEMVATLKRAAEGILDRGGILRKMESLGTKTLPYRLNVHGLRHTEGMYFLMRFDAPPPVIEELKDVCVRDVDIIRPSVSKIEKKVGFPCTLEEELQPPAYSGQECVIDVFCCKMASTSLGFLARRLSTSAGLAQLVKPPIQLFSMEGRYASALYSAASKNKKLEVVEKELNTLSNLLKTDPRLSEFLANPSIKRQLKRDGLASVAKKTNASDLTANLLQLLVENNRLNRLQVVINAYNTIMAAHRGEVICEITSAKALDNSTLKELEAALKAFLEPGQTILLTTKVDPSIVGGLVVSIGDRFVDMSLATKLNRYEKALQTGV
nr:EOG090X0EB8 [Lepidurus arcticus]